MLKGCHIAVKFLPCIRIHRVDNKVGMDVIPIRVGGNYDFKSRKLLRQFQRNFVDSLRCQVLVRMEGLQHMVEHSAIIFIVKPLGVHEFLEGCFRYTVHSSHQMPSFVFRFRFLTAVAERSPQATAGLGFC